MTAEEFSNQFDVLYSNIASNQAPGLNEYEKSVFLTKAQDEILKNYFLPQSNPTQAGYDDNQKRQVDFSMLTEVGEYISGQFTDGAFDKRLNTVNTIMPNDAMMIINETVTVTRGNKSIDLVAIPIRFDDYMRLMSKPYKRPLKYQAWRLYSATNATLSTADLIVGPEDEVEKYTIRYIRKPKPIIVGDTDDLTIGGYRFGIGPGKTEGCELDPILHEEILQRAIELAKVAWTATGQDNVQLVMQAGQRSE